MYFIQGEKMATKKAKKANKANLVAENLKTEIFQAMDGVIEASINAMHFQNERPAMELLQQKYDDLNYKFIELTHSKGTVNFDPDGDICPTYPHIPRPIIHWPWWKESIAQGHIKTLDEIQTDYPKYVKDHGPKLINILEKAGWETTVVATSKKAKVNPLKQLQAKIPEKNIKAISKAIINYFDIVEKAQIAIAEEIDKIIPEGIELTPIQIEKVVPPYVDVKIPVPEPRIPLDPKIPIPYPKTPLDPKIPIPRPEIRICGPIYDIKKLEVQLTEVERIRRDLPKNATKAEKKAAANAVQQVKNLLKAAKRAEPKAAKKAVAKKATVKKTATKKK